MENTLDPVAVRILGCLIEKEATTPDYYPLSLNALVNACNQKSNREPVMQLSDSEVERVLESLREKHFIWQRSVTGARVYKYEHNIKSILPLSDPELAVLCVVMLRGAQTVGEIRSRCERIFSFPTIQDAERTIRKMTESDENGALLMELPRQPGRKEPRFIHLLCGEEWAGAQAGEGGVITGESQTNMSSISPSRSGSERLEQLESEVTQLRDEVAELRQEVESFRKLLE